MTHAVRLSHTLLAVSLSVFAASFAHAGTLTTSATAPTFDADDVVQALFPSALDFDGGQDFSDNPTPGQTFTTPNTSSSYTLNAITLKGVGTGGAAAGGGFNSGNFGLRVSNISGTTLTTIATETADAAVLPNDDDFRYYITFALTTPVTLVANTQYAFDVFTQNGYFGFATFDDSDSYTGGSAFNANANRGFSDPGTATFRTGRDRTFYANLTANTVTVPESGSLALLALPIAGIAGMVLRRRAL
ncbi:MAG: PEP-CTERM sorting domain-containing protein [Armatimonadetes bacterium]|nr:PEP-CTERM sorting domain-containing protein [Armatimonadota bacterium]